MNTRKLRIAVVVLAAGLSGTAQAALQGRDLNGSADSFEAYYDTDLDITWLADANYAQTSGHDADGMMTWDNAITWTADLSFTDGVNIYDNWRLPTTLQPDASCDIQLGSGSYGYGCTGGEMGHLFYSELGGTAGQPILSSADPDLAKFSNIQQVYWSGLESAPLPSNAWVFFMGDGLDGFQDTNTKDDSLYVYAWAVSSGDVGAVPEADTWLMMLAGLWLVGAVVRRRKQSEA